MSSPCLSSVLTCANLTMYQPGLADGVLHQAPQSQGPRTSAPSYQHSSPHSWTKDQVLEWISDQVESSRADASILSLADCAVSGSTLCQMKTDQMIGVFGPQLGPQLQQSLQDHGFKQEFQIPPYAELSETCQLLDNFLDSFPLLSTIRLGHAEEPGSRRDLDFPADFNLPYLDLAPVAADELSDCSAESGFNESDPESPGQVVSKVQIKLEKGQAQLKRPRGRPPKAVHDHGAIYSGPKKTKHTPRGTHLWEFIRDILIHPEKNQGLMKWEDRHEGVFKFLKSEAVAQMWGQKKRNSSMTYEKLSRAMRYYYKRDILERVDGRRLVYKFGKNSSGWKMEELNQHAGGRR